MDETGINLPVSGAHAFNSLSSEVFDPLENNYMAQLFETKLLSEVRKAKSLYCSLDPDYNNMGKNRLQWLIIAEKCKKTISECVKKWHSLLRIYFSSKPDCKWVYYEDLKKFEPYLTNHKLHTPIKSQKFKFLRELWYMSNELQKPESTPEEHQTIWLDIITKCNDVTPGVIMSVINWQKYWVLAKQDIGKRLYTNAYKDMTQKPDLADKFTDEETKIIEICHATTLDTLADIITALGNNFELGLNKENIIPKCKKCFEQPNEILFGGCCSKCEKRPLFCRLCENGGATSSFNFTDWSKQALDLLPVELLSSDSERISVCYQCREKLKKKATIAWKVCRVCETNQSAMLESLHISKNNELRKAIKDFTRIEFTENDGLPGYICKDCVNEITNLYAFVKKFRRTQGKLLTVHLNRFIGTALDHPKSSNKPKEFTTKRVLETKGNGPLQKLLQVKKGNGPLKKCLPNKREIGITVAFNKLTPTARKIFAKNFPLTTNAGTVKLTPIRKSTNYDIIHEQEPESKETLNDTQMTAKEPREIAIKNVFSLKQSDQQKTIQSKTSNPVADVQKSIVNKIPFIDVVPIKLEPNDESTSCEIIPEQKFESKEIPNDTPINSTETKAPELAIKNFFSLQESNQKKKIQSDTNPVSVAGVSKSGKIDSDTSILSQPLQSYSKLYENVPTHVPIAVRVLPTKINPKKTLPTKKLPTLPMQKLPTKMSINTKKTSPWFASRTSKSPSFFQKSVLNKIMKLSPPTTSKPAIFTIPIDASAVLSEQAALTITTDYETIEDAPPVFCIPKNSIIQKNNFPSNADQQLIDFNPNPTKVIKIEKDLDDDPEYDCNEIPTTTSSSLLPPESTTYPKEEMYDPIEDLPQHHIHPFQPILQQEKNNTKVVRINGELIAVKPHPYIPGTFVQVDTNGEHQNSETGKIIRLKPKVIRKVNTLINLINGPMPEELPVNIKVDNKQEQQPGPKPRKYWGTVNEFQAKTLPVDPNTRAISSFDKNGVIASSVDPSIQCPLKKLTAIVKIQPTVPNVKVKRPCRRKAANLIEKARVKRSIHLFDKSLDIASSDDAFIQSSLEVQLKGENPFIKTEAVALDKSGDINSSVDSSIQSPLKIQIKEEISCDNIDDGAKVEPATEKTRVKRAYNRKAITLVGNAPNGRVNGGIDPNVRVKRAYRRKVIAVDGSIAQNTRVKRGYKRRAVTVDHSNNLSSNQPSIDNLSKVQIHQEISNNDDTTDCIITNETLNENLKLRSLFKLKKLRVVIKRDKRLQKMASKYARFSQLSEEKNSLVFGPHSVSLIY